MPGVKTAISLDEELFLKVNNLANNLHISRSKVFTLAVQDYVKKRENQAVLARLNEVYKDLPIEEERKILRSMRGKQKQLIEKESW
jgi:metal-responsive CopG/Arc/MetJ family transcriptional regulator